VSGPRRCCSIAHHVEAGNANGSAQQNFRCAKEKFFAGGPSRAVRSSRIIVEIEFRRAAVFFMGQKVVPPS